MWCIIAFDVVFRQMNTPEIEVGNCARKSTPAQIAHRDKSKRMSALIGTEDKDFLIRGTLPDQKRRRTTLNCTFNNEAPHPRLSVHGMAQTNITPDSCSLRSNQRNCMSHSNVYLDVRKPAPTVHEVPEEVYEL